MKSTLYSHREFATFIALIAIIVIFSVLNPIYLNPNNLLDIVEQSTINGFLALGITLPIITAGIDLSVGSTFAIVIVSVGIFTVVGIPPFISGILGIFLGLALGLVNGLLVTKMKLQPFIATLGMMSVYRGVAYIITGGWPVLNIPGNFRNLMDGELFLGIPSSILILFCFVIFGFLLLKHTRFGSYLYAMGSNEEATRLSGVNVDFYKMFAYGFSGTGAALAGMVMLARLGTGEPTAGQGYELNAIAAAAIGGTSLAGGKGSMLGTLLGAIVLSALKVGLIVLSVDTFWQYIATGLIIVFAAYFEVIQRRIQIRRLK